MKLSSQHTRLNKFLYGISKFHTTVGGLGTAAATNKWQRLAGRRESEPPAGNPPRGNSGTLDIEDVKGETP